MDNEKFTWADIKEFANKLDEQQLKEPVRWWGEEEGGVMINAVLLEEDYVQTDYSMEPASVQEYEEGEDPYEVALVKGTPILYNYSFLTPEEMAELD